MSIIDAKPPPPAFFIVPIGDGPMRDPILATFDVALKMAEANRKRAQAEKATEALEAFTGAVQFIHRREVGSVFFSRAMVIFCMVEATALYRTQQDLPRDFAKKDLS